MSIWVVLDLSTAVSGPNNQDQILYQNAWTVQNPPMELLQQKCLTFVWETEKRNLCIMIKTDSMSKRIVVRKQTQSFFPSSGKGKNSFVTAVVLKTACLQRKQKSKRNEM